MSTSDLELNYRCVSSEADGATVGAAAKTKFR